jgi:hypothetical protein
MPYGRLTLKGSQFDQKKKLQQDKCRMSIDKYRMKEFLLFYSLKSRATRGASACAARATSAIRQSSIVIPRSFIRAAAAA